MPGDTGASPISNIFLFFLCVCSRTTGTRLDAQLSWQSIGLAFQMLVQVRFPSWSVRVASQTYGAVFSKPFLWPHFSNKAPILFGNIRLLLILHISRTIQKELHQGWTMKRTKFSIDNLNFNTRPDFWGGGCAPPLGWLCTSPEIFSTSPTNFRTSPPPNNIVDEINFKRQLYKFNKKV